MADMESRRNGRFSEQVRAAREEAMSLRDDAASIVGEVERLLQMEMELAQAEVVEARQHVTRSIMFGAITAVFALLGTVFLFLAIMFALDTGLALWASALITMGIALVLALLLGVLARQQLKRFSPVPKRAIRTMQEDISWARSQLRSRVK